MNGDDWWFLEYTCVFTEVRASKELSKSTNWNEFKSQDHQVAIAGPLSKAFNPRLLSCINEIKCKSIWIKESTKSLNSLTQFHI